MISLGEDINLQILILERRIITFTFASSSIPICGVTKLRAKMGLALVCISYIRNVISFNEQNEVDRGTWFLGNVGKIYTDRQIDGKSLRTGIN